MNNFDKSKLERKLLEFREIKPSPDGRFHDCWYWIGGDNAGGYGITEVKIFGFQKLVHRLSAYIWLNFDIDSKFLVCHECDNPICFNYEHLFVGTDLDNIKDMIIKGRSNQGEKNKNSKLKEKEVLEIYDLIYSGIFLQKEIAELYDVKESTVWGISKKHSWRHILK